MWLKRGIGPAAEPGLEPEGEPAEEPGLEPEGEQPARSVAVKRAAANAAMTGGASDRRRA